jgi:hypothetical protein
MRSQNANYSSKTSVFSMPIYLEAKPSLAHCHCSKQTVCFSNTLSKEMAVRKKYKKERKKERNGLEITTSKPSVSNAN